jgi:hypothetical protein
MSDAVAIAQSASVTQAVLTQQALQTEILRQQAGQDQAVIALLQAGAGQAKALLPDGQGQAVDILA